MPSRVHRSPSTRPAFAHSARKKMQWSAWIRPAFARLPKRVSWFSTRSTSNCTEFGKVPGGGYEPGGAANASSLPFVFSRRSRRAVGGLLARTLGSGFDIFCHPLAGGEVPLYVRTRAISPNLLISFLLEVTCVDRAWEGSGP